MTTLQGAVVLVVGATGGLGSRIAAQLESNGAIVARSSRSAGHDLRIPSVVREVLEGVNAQYGRLDGLVVASGVVAFGAAADLEPLRREHDQCDPAYCAEPALPCGIGA